MKSEIRAHDSSSEDVSPLGKAVAHRTRPRTPSAAATIPDPNAPAAAPRSQHLQKGLGGRVSEKLVER